MKKIKIILIAATVLNSAAFAQNVSGPGAGTSSVSSANVKEPSINGIPYSQYAAQQKAQQAVTLAKPVGVPVQGTIAAEKPVTEIQSKSAVTIQAELKASQVNMEKKAQEMRANLESSNKVAAPINPVQETKPVYEIPKPAPGGVYALSLEKKAAATSTDPSGKQSPANNVKPVENLKYINSGPIAVPVADRKPVTTTTNAATGESVSSKMGLTVAPITGTVTPVENVATPAGVQAKIDNSKPVQIVEVPKSVAASKQPTEKPKN